MTSIKRVHGSFVLGVLFVSASWASEFQGSLPSGARSPQALARRLPAHPARSQFQSGTGLSQTSRQTTRAEEIQALSFAAPQVIRTFAAGGTAQYENI